MVDVRALPGYIKTTFDSNLFPVYHFDNGVTIVAATQLIPMTKEKVHGFAVNGIFCDTIESVKNTLSAA